MIINLYFFIIRNYIIIIYLNFINFTIDIIMIFIYYKTFIVYFLYLLPFTKVAYINGNIIQI